MIAATLVARMLLILAGVETHPGPTYTSFNVTLDPGFTILTPTITTVTALLQLLKTGQTTVMGKHNIR